MSDYNTILQCEKLHDLGYRWAILPERYTISYNGEIVADVKRPFYPLYDAKRIQRGLNENLQSVIDLCIAYQNDGALAHSLGYHRVDNPNPVLSNEWLKWDNCYLIAELEQNY